MKCKVKITCLKCGCSFELNSAAEIIGTSLRCPNCLQEFPRRDVSILANALSAMSEVKEHTETEPGITRDNEGFQLCVVSDQTCCEADLPRFE